MSSSISRLLYVLVVCLCTGCASEKGASATATSQSGDVMEGDPFAVAYNSIPAEQRNSRFTIPVEGEDCEIVFGEPGPNGNSIAYCSPGMKIKRGGGFCETNIAPQLRAEACFLPRCERLGAVFSNHTSLDGKGWTYNCTGTLADNTVYARTVIVCCV